jgi:tyrosyl-tRNA synthetase
MDPSEQLEALTANASEVVPLAELEAKLRLGRPLRVKHGVDPTAPHVHLGWSVPLRKLRQFQELGHIAVLVLGDFTARIGDPSGQDKTRPMLSKEQVDAYAQAVLGEIKKILLPERLEIRPNSEWLEGLGTQGVLELASEYTVARTLERDDFAKRFAEESPITVREFLYPLLQAYDSVAVEADIEIGGTDQHFTFMVARHIQRSYGQEPQVVMTFPLLEGTDGVKKMSQSLGNYIGITEEPNEMFGKIMRVPDELMIKYFRLVTDLPPDDVADIEAQIEAGALRPEEAKRRLAQEVVRMYHGADAAGDARTHFDRVFKDRQTPEEIPEIAIPDDAVADGRVDLARLLKGIGFAASTSDARRLIQQGGVHIDDETASANEVAVDSLTGKVLRVGKRHFARLV